MLQSLSTLLAIERRIYDQDGELTPLDEQDLETARKEVLDNVDKAAFSYHGKKADLERIKEACQSLIETRTKQLSAFNQFLKDVVTVYGDLAGTLTTMSLRMRNTRKVVVTDFVLCERSYPEFVTHTMDGDNRRVTSISKDKLRDHWDKTGGVGVQGFQIVFGETQYVDVRVPRKRSDPDNR